MTRLLRAAWSAPVVLLGYALAWPWRLAGWAQIQGRVFGFPDARLAWTRGPVARWFARRGWQGFTVGRTIFIWPGLPAAGLRDFLQHETEHVRQWLRLGVFFVPVYLYQLARYGYTRKRQTLPLEVEARREAEKP